MATREILTGDTLTWIDVCNPSRDELASLAIRYGLNSRMVEDCLDPEHLPKFEATDGRAFIIFRIIDTAAPPPRADSIRGLTRKIALFAQSNFVLSIHRAPLPELDELILRWSSRAERSCSDLLADVTAAVIDSYERPLEEAEDDIDRFETRLMANQDVLPQIKATHPVKRQIATYRRMLWHILGVIPKLHVFAKWDASLAQDLRENAEANHNYADELLEDLHSLLNLQLAMASHRTNEVVRILTLFSVFFMPLTFIVGIYGMNFPTMPELHWEHGYAFAWLLMATVSGGIYLWFRRKGYWR